MRFAVLVGAALACAACGDKDGVGPVVTGDRIQLTAAMLKSLDSTGQVIVAANPGDPTLKALVDSTLLVLTAGVEAKRLTVNTNLTTVPPLFVGVHRVFTRSNSSTWTLVGFDDPSHLVNLIEVSGFAQATGAPPTSVSGTIGDGRGVVNGLLMQVGANGAVTQWRATSGTASFSSDAAGAPCPNFTPTSVVTCAMETLHVKFTMNGVDATGGASPRQASIETEVDVPAMRLTFTPP